MTYGSDHTPLVLSLFKDEVPSPMPPCNGKTLRGRDDSEFEILDEVAEIFSAEIPSVRMDLILCNKTILHV